jgi:hypothetical protein
MLNGVSETLVKYTKKENEETKMAPDSVARCQTSLWFKQKHKIVRDSTIW